MTDAEVRSAVVRWLADVTGTTTIKAYQEGPRPATPYLMVNLTAVRAVREHEQEIVYANTGEITPAGKDEVSASPVIETEWQFSVHSYGSAPSAPLRKIRSAMKVNQAWEELSPLTPHEIGRINTVPEMVNEKWEPRANASLFIRGLDRDSFIVDVIEDASLDIDRA